MKYVDWVDRVLNAAARHCASSDEAALYGMNVGELVPLLGFGDAASQPGFMDGDLSEAVQDALQDLDDLGLVAEATQWRVRLTREGLKATDISLARSWHRIFYEVRPTDPEREFLRHVVRLGVVEEEGFARTKWLLATEVFSAFAWEWDPAKASRLCQALLDLNCVRGTSFIGGEFRIHPTYIGIVVATEDNRFQKRPVTAAAPSCFISYAHEDARLAREIANGLQDADLGVEIDEEMLVAGDSIVDRVAEATAAVEFVVAIISRHSVASRWCRYELVLAMTDELVLPGVKVLPVKVGDVEMPPTIRAKLYRSVDALGTTGVIEALVRDIAKHRERGGQEADR